MKLGPPSNEDGCAELPEIETACGDLNVLGREWAPAADPPAPMVAGRHDVAPSPISPPLALDDLAERGFVVVDDFLSHDEVAALRCRIDALAVAGRLAAASVGRGASRRDAPAIRGDAIAWIDGESPEEAALLARVETLRRALNERFWLALTDCELHFAHYPPGHGYIRHRDRFRDDDRRRVSMVIYLNDADWVPEHDGGELRLYADNVVASAGSDAASAANAAGGDTADRRRRSAPVSRFELAPGSPGGSPGETTQETADRETRGAMHGSATVASSETLLDEAMQDVAPLSGRAVLFLSERIEHEVRPAARDRYSIACWFRVRAPGPGDFFGA